MLIFPSTLCCVQLLTIEQEAWDSYIQTGNAVDPSFQYYPPNDQSQMNADVQPQGDPSVFGNSVFMGAGPNTPGR